MPPFASRYNSSHFVYYFKLPLRSLEYCLTGIDVGTFRCLLPFSGRDPTFCKVANGTGETRVNQSRCSITTARIFLSPKVKLSPNYYSKCLAKVGKVKKMFCSRNADELCSLLCFVLIKAKVPNLYSQLHMLADVVDKSLLRDWAGFCLYSFLGALECIMSIHVPCAWRQKYVRRVL